MMNNKLTIAILRYRTVIKVNWTKQEQIKETPKFWINQMIIFYGIFRLILSKMRRLTSILSVRTLFLRLFSSVIYILNKLCSTEVQIIILFTYRFKRTAKCVYILSIRLRFSGFVAIVINLADSR